MHPRHKKWLKWAAVAGAVLGVACHVLPPKYQAACNAASKVLSICTGGSV